jgi:hypothetical protein
VFAVNFSRAAVTVYPFLVNGGQVCVGEDEVCFALRASQKHGHRAKGLSIATLRRFYIFQVSIALMW